MDMLHTVELSTLFNSAPNPVFIKDENLRYVFVNKAYEIMFNVKSKQILGKNVLELDYLSEADKHFYQQEAMEILKHGKTKHHIFDYLYKGKTIHTCLYWNSRFVQKDGTHGIMGVIVDINRQSKEIKKLRHQLRTIAFEKNEVTKQNKIDPLTHLYNRGAFDEALQKLIASAEGFSCILLDIDHFKRVNDTFGHVEGDSVLKEIAPILQKHSRKRDMACRYGGEEFILLLPGSKLDNATAVAERIRRNISKNVHTPDGKNITVSAGCSEHLAGESGISVVERADNALYTAKQSGRNRVCTG